uniref:Meiotic nuclear division protein 1 homolog n=1 Tax=Eptatretus burgeri TaxID=7764 RepID=A0A8C4RB75_EPTBU
MSKKRGLSVEEKRTKMMEIFYESKDIFQLKELEKIAPRDKKITCQSVKDVLQSLVDDAMVDSDRIGTSNYFWAFPSKALHARECKIRELEGQLQDATNKKNSLEESVKTAGVGRETTKIRTLSPRMRRIDGQMVRRRLENIPQLSPQEDNVFSIKCWARDKFGFEDNQIDKTFSIPDDLDYIE